MFFFFFFFFFFVVNVMYLVFFFFSSRRRHTRWNCDWSSDVCSSDLTQAFVAFRSLTDDSRTLELLNRYEARFERQFRAALTAFLNLRAKRRVEEPEDATSETPKPRRRLKFYWIDDEGNKTLQADTYLDPDPVSGSFRVPGNELENEPVTDISNYRNNTIT